MQVFGVYMHLKHAAGAKSASNASSSTAQEASGKLAEFCAAVEAVTEAEMLQLGLPVLR